MNKFIKKNYKVLNILILCLCIYIFFLPVISKILEKILPGLTQCPFLTITGKPCPLCGGTRYIKNLGKVLYDVTYLFNFFGVISIITIIETIFRIINLSKSNYSERRIFIDVVIHIILVILFLLYELLYIINIVESY